MRAAVKNQEAAKKTEVSKTAEPAKPSADAARLARYFKLEYLVIFIIVLLAAAGIAARFKD